MYGSRMPRKLTVPKPFVEEHFRELNRVVTLENEEGKKWKVSFGEIRSYPSWQQGWRRLAIDHDLLPGEVIVVVVVGNSHFHFTRFDEAGNILSEKSTLSPLNDIADVKKKLSTTHSASQSHEKPGSVTNSEDESDPRTSWKFKGAAALASRYDHSIEAADCGTLSSGSGLDVGQGHEAPRQLLTTAEYPSKRRRLFTVGEIMSKANSKNESIQVINNEHAHDSEESGSMSAV